MQRVRTFIAIDPGKKIRQRLVKLQEAFQSENIRAKWVEPENLHLTLLFLGEVDLVTVPKICEVVEDISAGHHRFTMSLAGVGCFPNPRRPRVLWVGVQEGKDNVIAVHDDLEDPLQQLGCYRREVRKYTPHLTLGRIAGDKRNVPDLKPFLTNHQDWVAGETEVGELKVMSSELTPKGPIYTGLGRGQLA